MSNKPVTWLLFSGIQARGCGEDDLLELKFKPTSGRDEKDWKRCLNAVVVTGCRCDCATNCC